MVSAPKIKHMLQFLDHAPEGCVVEIGVHRGDSLTVLLNNAKDRNVFGYDTFCGFTDKSARDQGEWWNDDSHFKNTSLEHVRKRLEACGTDTNFLLIQGTYPDSDILKPSPIALAHLDTDTYESHRRALPHLEKLMAPGGRVYLDDFFTANCIGAKIATEEYLASVGREISTVGEVAWIQF